MEASIKVRSQLNKDLVAMHRTELIFAQSLKNIDELELRLQLRAAVIKDYQMITCPVISI